MLRLLWLIPAIPFASALVLTMAGHGLPRRMVAVAGVGSIALSVLLSLAVVPAWLALGTPYRQVLWTWLEVPSFHPEIAFYLDPVSLLMVGVVTVVSFLIHLYSAEFMEGDEGYSRFFAYMNLFVASMVVLLLADNLLLLYLGWEGVGLCSYLLIGFWYQDPANGRAARKAFIVTRVGDTAMILGLFLLQRELGTLRIQDLMRQASVQWAAGSPLATAAAALLLGGAVGKSAQLPLSTWLPDAMAGPTPTSALIHAATMVTAGVYLIARMHVLYSLAPAVQSAVAVIGAVTLLMAGCSALVQSDLKRVLAYSTISQIGYMFLALGTGSWQGALFHFTTHAFFKALLFLAAGIVIEALGHEHDIFRMGGLRKELPLAFWLFMVGGCSLAGLPLITAGAFSKDFILWQALTSRAGGPWLWAAGVAGVVLTGLYTFRLIFLVFFGNRTTPVTRRPGRRMAVPVLVLAVLSIAGGWWGNALRAFLSRALPAAVLVPGGGSIEALASVVAGLAFVLGLGLAYLFFLRQRGWAEGLAATAWGQRLHALWREDWGLDWLYDRAWVRPFVWVARANRRDFIDHGVTGIARLHELAFQALSRTENGRLRWYAAAVGIGAALFLGVAVFR
ncbi:MAG: NADH-quinone oxidoreductase subunit L [Holophaga sp.]